MPTSFPLDRLPSLATRVGDPAAIPAAERQGDDIYVYIVAMTGGGR
ncbi:hypothetical protein [Sphingomonas yantingensis]|jgi:hypothetical protein|uniref:Uncharacterized protein n=1 Tax=Sphingomonas yantingensis TaxID=1241761 RepID=A0A7W9EHU1_9SPHN|nr:hypothetical protein [Sphingomonas yantingensis]MBB5696946.1 hypothetical protein [Sphingomonas yantingensis]